MLLPKYLFKLLPWLIIIGFAAYFYFQSGNFFTVEPGKTVVNQSAVITRIQAMGKLELVQYNFREVTEIKKLSKVYDFSFFKWKAHADSKAVLISKGEAAGCLDLTKIQEEDINVQGDSVWIRLPEPELCYFKLDMENSRLYDLDASALSEEEERAFIEELYRLAEKDIQESALEGGILEQTTANANLILKPILEQLTNKKVFFSYQPEAVELNPL